MNNKNRNIALDIFRILVMFMIVMGHFLFHGGVIKNAPLFSVSYFSSNFLMSFLNVHVNCFVLLSGYFISTKQFRLDKVLELWLQIFFWSITLYMVIIMLQGGAFEPKELIKSLMPFTQQRYWFMTTYLLMYFMTPFLNISISTLTKKQYKLVLSVYFIIFICFQNIIVWRNFTSVSASDPLFFCFLYMIGAYLRKYPIKKKIPWFWIYVVCCLITSGSKFIITGITLSIFGEPIGETLFSGYCSITNVIGAVALFIVFVNLKIYINPKVGKWITRISTLTLGVYLIHDHTNVRTYIWNLFQPSSYIGSGILFFVLIIDSVVIFSICCVLEWARQKIFEVTGINKVIFRFGNKIVDGVKKTVL